MNPPSLTAQPGTPVQVMGVVNVTQDSFSDGGKFIDTDRAVEHGLALVAAGAQIIDVGGESTRPGATRIDPGVEAARVTPVIRELAAQGITISIDTMHADVARAALEAGAHIVNDVSGGRADPGMAGVLAEAKVPWILMHWRSVDADHPHRVPGYRDVVAEVRTELLAASNRSGSSSIPAWVSPRPPSTTGRCCMRCRTWWPRASRCWLARRANVSSVRCWPPRTAHRAHRTAVRPRPR